MMMMKVPRQLPIFLTVALFLVSSCSADYRDKQIKADLTMKAKQDVNFSGVRYLVENRRVYLDGCCATKEAHEALLQSIGTIHVIDSVEDHIKIAPVWIGPISTFKIKVDSVLAKYPTVMTSIDQDTILLAGKIKESEYPELMQRVTKIYPLIADVQLNKTR